MQEPMQPVLAGGFPAVGHIWNPQTQGSLTIWFKKIHFLAYKSEIDKENAEML